MHDAQLVKTTFRRGLESQAHKKTITHSIRRLFARVVILDRIRLVLNFQLSCREQIGCMYLLSRLGHPFWAYRSHASLRRSILPWHAVDRL